MEPGEKKDRVGTTRALPTSMDWFRQTANWLVGLSLAGLAWLGSRYDALTSHANVPLEGLYLFTALCFLTAVLSGIGFYHWLTYFASLYEREEATDTKVGTAVAEEGQVGKGIPKNSPRHNARKCYGKFFNAMKIAFPVGVVFCSLTVVAERFVQHTDAATSNVLLIDGRTQDSTHVGFSVLRLDTKTGLVLELFNDTVSGSVRWDTCHAFARESKNIDQLWVR